MTAAAATATATDAPAALVAVDASSLTTIGIGVIVGLVVLGLLIGLVITAIIGRIVVALVVVVAAVVVWQQRTAIQDKVDKAVQEHRCDLSASFFGLKVDAPQKLRDACHADS
ncbi:MAG: hypothetical protein ACTHMS_11050 [Jatrophihabitans sp.]|uniref:hypothetical protein n=1 Tax=Jatrophihabitans sp. TaxID=1932789 RepID=UPI003F808C73